MDFVILKVNGRDVSKVSQQEALAAFCSAEEPITLEIQRCDVNSNNSATPATSEVTYFRNELHTDLESEAALDEEFDDITVYYEEVTLHRDDVQEELGLSLGYGMGNCFQTEVIISDIKPGRAADVNGQVHIGDQIIQVNGIDVRDVSQAASLLSTKLHDITLLLGRHSCLKEEADCFELQEKDSGLGPGSDDSAKHSESSEHEETTCLPCLGHSKKQYCSCSNERVCLDKSPVTDVCGGQTCDCHKERPPSQNSIDRELQELHQEIENLSLSYNPTGKPPPRCLSDATGIESGASKPAREQRKSAVSLGVTVKHNKSKSSSKLKKRESLEEPTLESSSAYNTGESGQSNRSSPLHKELSQDERSSGSFVSLAETARVEDTQDMCPRGTRVEDPCYRGTHKEDTCHRGSRVEEKCHRHGESKEASLPEIVYTSPEQLERIILLQQQLLHQKIARFGEQLPSVQSANSDTVSRSQSQGHVSDMSNQSGGVQMEWKVKRRSDGTRYITKRPVRNKILKQRETRLLEQRCGMTTDDDMISELKTGRYWSKEDKRHHLAKARDQRRRRELMLRARLECLREQEEGKKEPDILQLAQKKQSLKKRQNFDDFVTVEEILAHGTKGDARSPYRPLLSVTTV